MDIHRAAKTGDVALLLQALEKGEDINALDDQGGASALYRAVCYGKNDVFQVLLANNADVNQALGKSVDPDWEPPAWTPLHAAAETDGVEMAAALIEHGAFLDAADQFGRTPLFAALDEMVGPDVAKLLIRCGADVNVVSYSSTPLEFAKMYGREDIADMLRAAGAKDKAG